jgi:hypothetical protein
MPHTTHTHFVHRAKERAGISAASDLYGDLRIALQNPDRWSDFIEPVKKVSDGAVAYRFRTEEGIFYVIAKDCYPITIFTQSQMASKKWGIKARKRKLPARQGVKMR